MQATVLLEKTPSNAPKKAAPPAREPRKISWPEFQKRYLEREDGFKYEWVESQIIKTDSMHYSQFFIIDNLQLVFQSLRVAGKFRGQLIQEGDMFFGSNHRKPDLAYLTRQQIAETSKNINQVPAFVIEIVSSNDKLKRVAGKMGDFRAAGVQVVWQILPDLEEVHVYSGRDLRQMTVQKGDDVCSAAPVLPDFEMTANAIFLRPIED